MIALGMRTTFSVFFRFQVIANYEFLGNRSRGAPEFFFFVPLFGECYATQSHIWDMRERWPLC